MNNEPLFDMKVIDDLREMLGRDVAEIYQEYLNNSRQILSDMVQAAAQHDTEGLTHLAHTLKGSSGNLGVAQIYALAMALEKEGRSGSIANPQAHVQRLQESFTASEETLVELASLH